MIINKPYTNKQYADLVSYCSQNDCHVEDKGTFLEAVKNEHPAPTINEVKKIRSMLYKQYVDPITSHIQRLRDDVEPDEEKIANLISERNELVEKIKQENPYPEAQDDQQDI